MHLSHCSQIAWGPKIFLMGTQFWVMSGTNESPPNFSLSASVFFFSSSSSRALATPDLPEPSHRKMYHHSRMNYSTCDGRIIELLIAELSTNTRLPIISVIFICLNTIITWLNDTIIIIMTNQLIYFANVKTLRKFFQIMSASQKVQTLTQYNQRFLNSFLDKLQL